MSPVGPANLTGNRFYDSTDLSLSIEYTSNCDIAGNKVYQVSRHAFGGFAIGNHDQPGTVMSGNTINGASKMSIGISVGGNPWCMRGAHGGATISYNTISGAYYGMNVQEVRRDRPRGRDRKYAAEPDREPAVSRAIPSKRGSESQLILADQAAVKSGTAKQLDVTGDLRKCSERVYESFVRGDQAGLEPNR